MRPFHACEFNYGVVYVLIIARYRGKIHTTNRVHNNIIFSHCTCCIHRTAMCLFRVGKLINECRFKRAFLFSHEIRKYVYICIQGVRNNRNYSIYPIWLYGDF